MPMQAAQSISTNGWRPDRGPYCLRSAFSLLPFAHIVITEWPGAALTARPPGAAKRRERTQPVSFAAEVLVGKVQVALPIEIGDIVFAATNVITDGIHDRFIDLRHVDGAEPLFTEKLVHRRSVFS